MAKKKHQKKRQKRKKQAALSTAKSEQKVKPSAATQKKLAAARDIEKKRLTIFTAIFLLLILFVALTGGIGRPAVPSGAIALVEGVGDVPDQEYRVALQQSWKRAGLTSAPKPSSSQYKTSKDEAINDLLDRLWLEGEAREMGVSATSREVRNELNSIKETQFPGKGAYQKFLLDSGFTEQDVRERVRLQVLSRKIETQVRESVEPPSEEAILLFYEKSIDQYTTPEDRSLLLIIAKNEKEAAAAKASLQKDSSEKNFFRLSKKYSEGKAVKASEAALPPEVASEVAAASKNQTGGPIKDQKKTYFFRVLEVIPEKVRTLTAVRKEIKDQLVPSLEQQALESFISDYNSKWISRTICAEGFIVSRCANYTPGTKNPEADPACYSEEKFNKAKEPVSCPAPVVAPKPAEPGAKIDPFGEYLLQPKPQGPVFPADVKVTPQPISPQPAPLGS